MALYSAEGALGAVVPYKRQSALPLDLFEVQESLEAAQAYISGNESRAYAGQTIKVLEDGVFETYVVQGTSGNLSLAKVGVDQSQLKQFVQIVDNIAGVTAPEQGVIYLDTTSSKGYIYNGSDFVVVFENVVDEEGNDLTAQLKNLEDKFLAYAALTGATFTGEVILAADPTQAMGAATKQYVDALVSDINSFTIGTVDSEHPLPSEVSIGQTFRVIESGEYAGQNCEPGDLIIVVADSENATNDDFIVVNVNIDGSAYVVGPNSANENNLPVFEGISGKLIKDSGVALSDVSDAISKKHSHENMEVLNSFDKKQDQILQDATDKVAALEGTINTKLDSKLDIETAADTYYTKASWTSDKALIDEILSNKAAKSELTQLQTDLETSIAAKANAEDVYTKEETDELLAAKVATSDYNAKVEELTNSIADKANAADVYTQAQVDTALANKANSADVYTQSEIDSKLADKANAADVYTKSEIDTTIGDLEDYTTISDFVLNKISDVAGGEVGEQVKQAAISASKTYTDARIGDISSETTVKQYIDSSITNAALVMNEF